MRATSEIKRTGLSRIRQKSSPFSGIRESRATIQGLTAHKHFALVVILIIAAITLPDAVATIQGGGVTIVASGVLAVHLACDAILVAAILLRSMEGWRGGIERQQMMSPAAPLAEIGGAADAGDGAPFAGSTATGRGPETETGARSTAGPPVTDSMRRAEDLMIRTNTATVAIASDTTILDGNQALPRLLGRAAVEEVVGHRLADVLDLKNDRAAHHFCNETVRLGTFTCHLEATSPAGGTVWIEANGAASVLNGRPCVMAIFRDISERKTAELALMRSNEALSAALEVARDANSARSGFVAKMNHELRTPLNGIIGLSEMLRHTASDRNVPGAEVRKFCEHIHRSGTHLLSLVEDLLDLSRLEAGTWSLNPTEIDVAAELNAALITLVPIAHKKQVVVEQICPPDFRWHLDQRAFRQIIINLATNAVKFSPPQSKVRIAVTRSASEMTLHVIDEGPGIPGPELERIAMPFGRGAYAVNHKIDGVGLGIPIVSELLRLHGGKLLIDSEPGHGSTFSALFPAGVRPANSFQVAAE